jgi:hypothetical protein
VVGDGKPPHRNLGCHREGIVMQTVLIVLATIAGVKLAKYLWSIVWEWA